MDTDERYLKNQLKHWQVSSPPAGLADSIVRSAVALPQRRPWWLQIQQAVETACVDWRYGLSYKLAALAVCAVIGLAGGMHQSLDSGTDMAMLAFTDSVYDMEGI